MEKQQVCRHILAALG